MLQSFSLQHEMAGKLLVLAEKSFLLAIKISALAGSGEKVAKKIVKNCYKYFFPDFRIFPLINEIMDWENPFSSHPFNFS